MTFDADSHVEESAQTWKHLDEKFARRRSIPITLEDQPALLRQNSFYVICEEDDRFTRAAEVDRRRPDHARFRYAAFGESPELVAKISGTKRPERRDQSQDSKRQCPPVFFTLIPLPLNKKCAHNRRMHVAYSQFLSLDS